MLNQALRYAPIVDGLRSRASTGPILEVGAGATGLARYIADRTIVGVDLKFDRLPHERMRSVIASAAALPFRSAAFRVGRVSAYGAGAAAASAGAGSAAGRGAGSGTLFGEIERR